MRRLSFPLLLLTFGIAANIAPAQTFTTLDSFNVTNGEVPYGGLVQATNGDLYGTTLEGGATIYNGAAFKITPSGTLTRIYSFCSKVENGECADGLNPVGGLVQAGNGDFYGTTYGGGAGCSPGGCGTVFKITPGGTLTTLHNFCSESGCADGEIPQAGLIQATNGYLYGTTSGAGTASPGTVFKMTPSGALTTLYTFCAEAGCTDGENPVAGLVQAANRDLYGTTEAGGANCAPSGCGTVFKITPSGTLTTLYSFCAQSGCTDGGVPYGALVQATNGDLYGTTYGGGAKSAGTVFKITPGGAFTSLYSFCSVVVSGGCADGAEPSFALIQTTDGNLYGTTQAGGANDKGTLFKITPGGTLTTLYSFCAKSACADGESPYFAGLVQDTNGKIYGTTNGGGANGAGTVFRLSLGLGLFVETQPTSGIVGEAVKILGSDLTGATGVTFNGASAAFTVVSATEISTTVPAGATTGKVKVITPSGTLSSNKAFEVAP